MSLANVKSPLKVELIKKVPHFSIYSDNDLLQLVFGYTKTGTNNKITFPAFYPYHRHVVNDLKKLRFKNFSNDALNHNEEQNKISKKIKSLDTQGYKFFTEPFDWQLEGFVYGINILRLGLLFDPGLGKTKTALDIVRFLQCRAIVVCMALNLSTWRKNLEKHTPDLSYILIDGYSTKKKNEAMEQALHEKPHLTIISYDLLKKFVPGKRNLKTKKIEFGNPNCDPALSIMKIKPHMMILDESQKLRKNDSQRTRTALYVASMAPRRIIMTGTHDLGDPTHTWGQQRFMAPFMANSFYEFKNKFTVHARNNKHIIVGYKNLDILNNRIRKYALIKDKDVLDLPPQTFHTIEIEPTAPIRKAYNELLKDNKVILPNDKPYEILERIVQLTKLQQITSGFIVENKDVTEQCRDCDFIQNCIKYAITPFSPHCKHRINRNKAFDIHHFKSNPKVEMLFNKIDEILVSGNNRILIWCRFRPELQLVYKLLVKEYGENYVTQLHGGLTKKQRQTELDRFESDKNVKINIGQVQMGVGINELTDANYTFYISLSTDLEHYLQSVDRNYRIGTVRQVTVYFLVIKHAIDNLIRLASENKINISANISRMINCVTCHQAQQCLLGNIKPFKKGCIYKKSISRTMLKPGRI